MKENGDAAAWRLIDAYLRRRGLTEMAATTECSNHSDHTRTTMKVVVFDRRYRIELRPCRRGTVLLRGRLLMLPSPGTQRDAALLRLGRIALWSASRFPGSCAVDQRARAAWLQVVFAPSSDDAGTDFARDAEADVAGFAQALGRFVDAFAAWRDILARPEAAAVDRAAPRAPSFFLSA